MGVLVCIVDRWKKLSSRLELQHRQADLFVLNVVCLFLFILILFAAKDIRILFDVNALFVSLRVFFYQVCARLLYSSTFLFCDK